MSWIQSILGRKTYTNKWDKLWDKPIKYENILIDGVNSLSKILPIEVDNRDLDGKFYTFLNLYKRKYNNNSFLYKLFNKEEEMESLCRKYLKMSNKQFQHYLSQTDKPVFIPNDNYFKDVAQDFIYELDLNCDINILTQTLRFCYGRDPKRTYSSPKTFFLYLYMYMNHKDKELWHEITVKTMAYLDFKGDMKHFISNFYKGFKT